MGTTVQALSLTTLATALVSSVSFEMRAENIWGLINSMQLIQLFGLVNLHSLPENYQSYLEYLDFAHGDFQFLQLLPNFLRYVLPLDYAGLESEQSQFNQRFAEKGIQQTSLYLNYETRIVGILYYCLFTFFAFLFSFIFKRNPKAQKCFKKIYLNSICHRVLVEIYVQLALLSFLSFFGISFDNSGSTFDFLLTFIVSCGIVAYPLSLFLCLTQHHTHLSQIKKKWRGHFYTQELRNGKYERFVFLYYVFFLLERLAFILNILLLHRNPTLQLSLMLLQFTLSFCYLLIIRPFESKLENFLQILNYITMMIQVCFFLFFSQIDRGRFSISQSTRSIIGLVMLALLFSNFGFHILLILGSLVSEFIKKCKRKGSRIVSVKTAETTEEKPKLKHFHKFSKFHHSDREMVVDSSSRR